MSGTCLNASGMFFTSNLCVESKHLKILNIWGGSFASPSERTHLRQTHQEQQIYPNDTISWNVRNIKHSHDCSGKQHQLSIFSVTDFWPNPGPGCRSLGSGRGVESAGVVTSVASWVISFVSKFILWNHVTKYTRTRPGLVFVIFQPWTHVSHEGS